jgi:hypothetical protein
MKVSRRQAIQVHPVPDRMVEPQGPFPRELFREPKIVIDEDDPYSDDGSNHPLGATVQNNFTPEKYLRCSRCFSRVTESETKNHSCEE